MSQQQQQQQHPHEERDDRDGPPASADAPGRADAASPDPSAPAPRDGRGRYVGDVSGDRMARARAARRGGHRATHFKHFKIDLALAPDLRDQYERLARDPAKTLPELREWLRAHGVVVSRQTVGKHRTYLSLDARRLRECTEMAGAFVELTRAHGPSALAEANQARFEMNLMQSLFKMADAPTMTEAEWQSQARLTRAALDNRRLVESMREEQERRMKLAAEEAERLAKKGGSGIDVVRRVREILGIEDDLEDDDGFDTPGGA